MFTSIKLVRLFVAIFSLEASVHEETIIYWVSPHRLWPGGLTKVALIKPPLYWVYSCASRMKCFDIYSLNLLIYICKNLCLCFLLPLHSIHSDTLTVSSCIVFDLAICINCKVYCIYNNVCLSRDSILLLFNIVLLIL